MIGTRKLLTPLALALLASSGTQAQTSAPPNPAMVQQSQPATRPASPQAPRTIAVNWDQARADARRQGVANNQAAAAVRVAPEMPRPSNSEASVLLFPRTDFYTLSITGDGLVIEVFGTRLAHAVAPDAVTARQLRATGPDELRVSATEYGQVADFNRYGAAYSVTLECDNPQSDPRCADDVLVRRLARSLIIAAGSPGEGG